MSSSNKLQVSKLGTKELDHLSARLGLRPNIICRLALGKSLSVADSVKNFAREEGEEKGCEDVVPREFNRFTLTGDSDAVYKILVYQHEFDCSGIKIPENQYYKVYFRNHLERGLDLLYFEYQRINSPIEFLRSLIK